MTTGPKQPTRSNSFAVSDKSLRLVICEVSENIEWNMKLSLMGSGSEKHEATLTPDCRLAEAEQ